MRTATGLRRPSLHGAELETWRVPSVYFYSPIFTRLYWCKQEIYLQLLSIPVSCTGSNSVTNPSAPAGQRFYLNYRSSVYGHELSKGGYRPWSTSNFLFATMAHEAVPRILHAIYDTVNYLVSMPAFVTSHNCILLCTALLSRQLHPKCGINALLHAIFSSFHCNVAAYNLLAAVSLGIQCEEWFI